MGRERMFTSAYEYILTIWKGVTQHVYKYFKVWSMLKLHSYKKQYFSFIQLKQKKTRIIIIVISKLYSYFWKKLFLYSSVSSIINGINDQDWVYFRW